MFRKVQVRADLLLALSMTLQTTVDSQSYPIHARNTSTHFTTKFMAVRDAVRTASLCHPCITAIRYKCRSYSTFAVSKSIMQLSAQANHT